MFGCLCDFFTFPRVDSQLTLQVVVPTTDYPVYLALRRTAADINCTATVATVQTAITHARLRRPRDTAAAHAREVRIAATADGTSAATLVSSAFR